MCLIYHIHPVIDVIIQVSSVNEGNHLRHMFLFLIECLTSSGVNNIKHN